MKKMLLILSVMILACSSNSKKTISPELYNTITTGIYVFDEEKLGEYHKVIFKQDGTIEGAKYLSLEDDIRWKCNEQSRIIDLYSSDLTKEIGFIHFPISNYNDYPSEYNGNYKSFSKGLDVLSIKNSNQERKTFVYTTYSSIIESIVKKSDEIKKNEENKIKFLSTVDKNNLYIFELSENKNFEKFNTITQYKELSYYELFDEAYFNKKENPNIFNNSELNDDEFVYREKKPIYAEIRKKKYLFIHSDMTNENIKFELSEYDFNKKGYYCTIKKITPIGGIMGAGPFGVIEIVSKPFFISINEKEAQEFKNHKFEFSVIAELSTKTKQIKVTRIKINELGITDVAVDETLWKTYKEKYIQHASKCYISNEKIKQLNLNVINYQITDTDTDIRYTNIK